MPTENVKKADKIKMIDQMLEDFAGDEFDDYQESYRGMSSGNKHYSADEDLASLDDIY